jgi:hypothetical protein
MRDKDFAADFPKRAKEMREIVRCIFDKNDRRALLKFIKDFEQMATPKRS